MTIKFPNFKHEFQQSFLKWFQNPRTKEDSPMATAAQPNPSLKIPVTPLRRNRDLGSSKTLSPLQPCSSSTPNCGSEVTMTSDVTMLSNDTLKIKVRGPSSSTLSRKSKQSSHPSSPCIQEEEEPVSSRDEATAGNFYCGEESSPVCSLVGSWRGSDRSSSNGSWRGSQSQGSQDSGYSDSRELNVGGQNEVDEPCNQPQVRHITRVYFGNYGSQPSACNISYNTEATNTATPSFTSRQTQPKTSCNSKLLFNKLGKGKNKVSPHNSSLQKLNNIERPNILDRTSTLRKGSSLRSILSTSSLNFDTIDESQLEHKSLLDTPPSTLYPLNSNRKRLSKSILKALFNDQRINHSPGQESNPKTPSRSEPEKTSNRKYRKVSKGKRHPTRSRSTEKIFDGETNAAYIAAPPWRSEPPKPLRRCFSSDQDRSSPFWGDTINIAPLLPLSRTSSLRAGSSSPCCEDSTSSLSLPQSELSSIEIAESMRNESLRQWLEELQTLCESECMNTLQSKSLHSDASSQKVASSHANLSSIQKEAHVVSAEFALLCQRLEFLQLDQVPTLVHSLVIYVQNFIETHCKTEASSMSQSYPSKSSLKHQVRVIEQICSRLIEVCSESIRRSTDLDERPKPDHSREEEEEKDYLEEGADEAISNSTLKTPPRFESHMLQGGEIDSHMIREFVQIVTALGHAFTKLVDLLLTQGMKALVCVLEDPEDEREVECAISEVTSLGVNGGHVCRLVGRVGGIRALLGVCLESRFRRLRPLALRAIATVCCVAEGISFFEKDGGVEVIAEVLCDCESPEEDRSEAAGVLAQITSPWVEDNNSLPCLQGLLQELVKALTELAKSTTSPEVFLLTSAALANLTFLDVSCIDALLTSSTHRVLLEEVQMEEELSVFTKDQIATILANMSSTPLAARKVVEAGGIEVLLSLLQTGPPESLRLAEVAATERVQQKSAIALSRICTKPEAADQFLRLGGVRRLVHLCKNKHERNQSDAVLVACLAALRKIAASCGNEELRQVDACELVEPRLLDSFLIYSSQQESYV